MSAVVRFEEPRTVEIDADTEVTTAGRWVVALGEYADQGEPDCLIYVSHAVSQTGTDIREGIARRIAALLDGAA